MPNRQPDWLSLPETKSNLLVHHPSTSIIDQPDTFKQSGVNGQRVNGETEGVSHVSHHLFLTCSHRGKLLSV